MQKSTTALLDTLFPRHCLSCNKLLPSALPDSYLCEPCFELIPQNTVSRCAFCPKAVTLWKTCPACRPQHALDSLLVATDYRDPAVERMVKALKYRFVRLVAHDIGKLMANYLEQRASLIGLKTRDCILASIPLHLSRLRWRGFNQAALIADEISMRLAIPVRHDVLQRMKNRVPQADIENREERIENAKNLFSTHRVPVKTILLIDDVATTGSTLDNAARELKNAGAPRVIGFVFARG